MVAVGRRQMTDNFTGEDLIRMATAHFDAENLHEAVKVDENHEKAPVLVVKKGETRAADWFKSWKVMRKLNKFSGESGAAATAAAARGRRPCQTGASMTSRTTTRAPRWEGCAASSKSDLSVRRPPKRRPRLTLLSKGRLL